MYQSNVINEKLKALTLIRIFLTLHEKEKKEKNNNKGLWPN